MKEIKKLLITILVIAGLFIAGCSNGVQTNNVQSGNNVVVSKVEETKVFKVGSIMPLSGDAAFMGEAVVDVHAVAVKDINAKWKAEGKNQKIEIVYEDGKCNPKDGLTAIQSLVNLKGVKVILGAGCSGETLGAAPFAESNKVIMMSPASTSPKVSEAGDYIFRNVGSDAYQAIVAGEKVASSGVKKVAILSENTDYAQDLRNAFKVKVESAGLEVVADEVVHSDQKDLKTEVLKIKNSGAEAIFIIPQSFPTGVIYVDHIVEGNLGDVQLYGAEVLAFEETINELPNGMIVFKQAFDDTTASFQDLKAKTGCELGLYCATIYDGALLISEVLDKCGDKDTDCIKNELYNTQGWQGKYQGEVSFDANGDVSTDFDAYKVMDGKLVEQN